MRKFIIGGNWKMNRGTPQAAKDMLEEFIRLVREINNVDIFIAPPFTSLGGASILLNTNIKIGAQNMYFEDTGAFTGEISAKFLKTLNVEYIILGHSERRNIFKETDEMINKKLKKALEEGLKPVVCIGEHLEEREAGNTKNVIKRQMEGTFKDLKKEQIIRTVIAYEPIWAIGTGRTATPQQADEVHAYIREILEKTYDANTASSIRIQYGGSVKPNNARELFEMENIDGGLVGGASLEAASFAAIIKAATKEK
ncbi:MAG: Triosephosphate isomerase [Promethearchaeota archaeon]|nr:MAG: Triosephosphate isomerase [Candidatus Lokiarchaeota archaeon]